MSNTPTCKWLGQSGKTYAFYIFPIGTVFEPVGGNYVFCTRNAAGKWVPQYIGQTDNLKDRLADHDKEACAKRNGATHIHAHRNATKADRLAEEKDLIQNYDPSCNMQHVD